GAGAGVQVLTKGQQVKIPSETRLDFTLQQPFDVTYFPGRTSRHSSSADQPLPAMTMKKSSLSRTSTSRREFLQAGALAGAATLASPAKLAAEPQESALPSAFSGLKPLGSRIRPIATEEYLARHARAQKLMAEAGAKFDAIFVAPTTSLYYFT